MVIVEVGTGTGVGAAVRSVRTGERDGRAGVEEVRRVRGEREVQRAMRAGLPRRGAGREMRLRGAVNEIVSGVAIVQGKGGRTCSSEDRTSTSHNSQRSVPSVPFSSYESLPCSTPADFPLTSSARSPGMRHSSACLSHSSLRISFPHAPFPRKHLTVKSSSSSLTALGAGSQLCTESSGERSMGQERARESERARQARQNRCWHVGVCTGSASGPLRALSAT